MRKLVKVLVGIALILSVVSFVACGSDGPSVVRPSAPTTPTIANFNMDVITTIGNRSYIPINIGGRPDENVSLILGVLKRFEKEKQIGIVSWQVDKQQSAYDTNQKIFGIWVEHRSAK